MLQQWHLPALENDKGTSIDLGYVSRIMSLMEGFKELRGKSLSIAYFLATCAVCMSQFVVSHLLYLEFCTSGCIFF